MGDIWRTGSGVQSIRIYPRHGEREREGEAVPFAEVTTLVCSSAAVRLLGKQACERDAAREGGREGDAKSLAHI